MSSKQQFGRSMMVTALGASSAACDAPAQSARTQPAGWPDDTGMERGIAAQSDLAPRETRPEVTQLRDATQRLLRRDSATLCDLVICN